MAETKGMHSEQAGRPAVGIVVAERLYGGLVQGDEIAGGLEAYPAETTADPDDEMSLLEMPAHELLEQICELAARKARSSDSGVSAIGVALPGFVRQGVVEEAPNLPQLKGARIQDVLKMGLERVGIKAPVLLVNDADAFAAGLACRQGQLDRHLRVWTLGTGIGFGRYPFLEGVWEGGHTVVTLDDKERYCGCGGRGHLEGIMGHRAMRLRFLDMEPEEVFAEANKRNPDARCLEFKKMWHRGLAAATATSIHLDGAGKFFLAGFNTRFVDLNMLKDYLHQMVNMSPLQSYSVEIVQDDHNTRALGAAVTALQVTGS